MIYPDFFNSSATPALQRSHVRMYAIGKSDLLHTKNTLAQTEWLGISSRIYVTTTMKNITIKKKVILRG